MARTRNQRYLTRRSSVYAPILSVLIILSMFLLVLVLGIFHLPVSFVVNLPSSSSSDHKMKHERSIYEKGTRGKQWSEILSWEPRVFIYHNFLSEEECTHLITLAKPHLKKSYVVNRVTGKSMASRARTSSGMFLKRGQDAVVKRIEKRIADYTFIPVEHGEGLQVLHYKVGQKYAPHRDYFEDDINIKRVGRRMATLLMYLSDVEEGGETVFPKARGVNMTSLPWYNELSECGKKGLSFKPKMGDALLFWSMKPDATLDPLSLHGACPVIKGNKWSATKWLHIGEFIEYSI